MTTCFNTAFNTFNLERFPKQKNLNLQAWDAADRYLLEHLYEQHAELENKNILIFNDAFGALTLSLLEYHPCVVSDSIISQKAIIENTSLNQIDKKKVKFLNSLSTHTKIYDYVIIKTPKTLDYLRYFIDSISQHIHSNTQIIVAGMVKNMPKTIWSILEQKIGETNTSLAKKKARLIFVKPEKKPNKLPPVKTFTQENTEFKIFNHANVFSKQSLDIGTRFLLQNLPKLSGIKSIVDLGCGNGVVGLNLAILYPKAKITFIDESYMAVASAKLTCEFNLKSLDNCQFLVNNCLDHFTPSSTDLIVCNPPFHQSHSIGTHIALQMFKQSHITLNKGGIFLVIANRHLPYYSHLKRIFGKVNNLAGNAKFSIYSMTK